MSSGSTHRLDSNYYGTSTYLQLARKSFFTDSFDFVRLFSLISLLNTYITTTNGDDLQSEALRAPFIAVMEEANRIKEVIEADQPLKDADIACRAEMLTLLGKLKIREDEAKSRAKRLLAATALLTVGAVFVGPALAVGGLNLIGFSSVGPVAGSIAAGIQSAVYGGAVGAGSIFAMCQSAAMGGIVVGSAAEIAAGVAALGAGAELLGGIAVGGVAETAAGVAALGAGAGLLGGLGDFDNKDGVRRRRVQRNRIQQRSDTLNLD